MKRVGSNKIPQNKRFMCCLLGVLQFTTAINCEIILNLVITNDLSVVSILKSFVSLLFVLKIDDQFTEYYPEAIKETTEDMAIVLGKDQNTFRDIKKRIKCGGFEKAITTTFSGIVDLLINLIYWAFWEVYLVFYYY